jgi:uncharacterized membrane protein
VGTVTYSNRIWDFVVIKGLSGGLGGPAYLAVRGLAYGKIVVFEM